MIPPAFEVLSDRYRINAEIGSGGMATVYLADDVKHGRRVAIKVLKPEIAAAIGRERFLREIEIVARLNHPHIVPLFDAIQWSYDQLTDDEQRLLRALSVFAGGWTLEIAARVVRDDADEFETLDFLSRLVDKSLVMVDRRPGGDTRYTLLETVRQYGAERLVERGDSGAVRRRHAEAFLAITECAHTDRVTKEARWAELLATEHDNVRAALAFFRDNEPEKYLELAGALAWFWQASSRLLEGREHLTRAPAASPATPARKTYARGAVGRRLPSRAARRHHDLDANDGGAVEAEYERIGSTMHVRFWDALLTKHLGAARQALGPADAARAWAAGRASPFDAAVEQALKVAARQ